MRETQQLLSDPGHPLPPWSRGVLDIHHINTGRGNATFFILPDGTTVLVDAGELNPDVPRNQGPRAMALLPNTSKTPGGWIVDYLRQMLVHQPHPRLDYVIVTHFHDDHLGAISSQSAHSNHGPYRLSGVTEVGDAIPVRTLLDRAWPNYNYPIPLETETLLNYRAFLTYQREANGLRVERFIPGRNDQVVLRHDLPAFDNFEWRNVAANGELWTGLGVNTRHHIPPLEDLEPTQYPDENMLSIAFRLSYGAFDYFAGADLAGIIDLGKPLWHDLETPVGQAVGPVEVNVVNHHGNRSSANEYFLQALRPRVHILQTWSSDQPGHDVLRRLQSTYLYPGPRDIFATGIMEANKLVIGPALEGLAANQGHIVIRVEPGGHHYHVIVLEDHSPRRHVLTVHGPYESR